MTTDTTTLDDRPIPRIIRERNEWRDAERFAHAERNQVQAHLCATVANRLSWVLAVLGVDEHPTGEKS